MQPADLGPFLHVDHPSSPARIEPGFEFQHSKWWTREKGGQYSTVDRGSVFTRRRQTPRRAIGGGHPEIIADSVARTPMTTVHDATLAILLRLFDEPVMLNTVRPDYVELQVGVLLGDRWRHVGQWDGWDYETGDGAEACPARSEKAGAAKQVWEQKAPSVCSFDIKPRTGYFRAVLSGSKGSVATWTSTSSPGTTDTTIPTNANEGQWIYYVVATTKLSGLSEGRPCSGLDELVREEGARCVGASDLRGAVDAVALEVLTRRRDACRASSLWSRRRGADHPPAHRLITRRSLVQIQPPPPIE